MEMAKRVWRFIFFGDDNLIEIMFWGMNYGSNNNEPEMIYIVDISNVLKSPILILIEINNKLIEIAFWEEKNTVNWNGQIKNDLYSYHT